MQGWINYLKQIDSRAIAGLLVPISLSVVWGTAATAQVTADGTLSTTVSHSGSNFTISNGNRVGNNLFHSFSQFSVPTGGAAFFNNASDVQTIFSRVTGAAFQILMAGFKPTAMLTCFCLIRPAFSLVPIQA